MPKFLIIFLISVFVLVQAKTNEAQCSYLLQQTWQAAMTDQSQLQENAIDKVWNVLERLPILVSSCFEKNHANLLTQYLPQNCISSLHSSLRSTMILLKDEGSWFQKSKEKVRLGLQMGMIIEECPFAQNVTIQDLYSLNNCFSKLKKNLVISKFSSITQLNDENFISQLKLARSEIQQNLKVCNRNWASIFQNNFTESCIEAIMEMVYSLKKQNRSYGNASSFKQSIYAIQKSCKLME